MAEPTTPVTIAALSAVSLFPFINGNALLGAVLGAAFIATFEKDLNAFQRIRNMLLATGIGYILSLIHISEPTRHFKRSRMPSSA